VLPASNAKELLINLQSISLAEMLNLQNCFIISCVNLLDLTSKNTQKLQQKHMVSIKNYQGIEVHV